MSITVLAQPKDYGAGYSALPLRFESDNTGEELKYLVNICYDTTVYNSSVPYSFNGQTYTKIDVNGTHGYKVGDLVLFYNPNTPSYTGVYTVVEVIDADEFVIDLTIGQAVDNSTASYFFRVVSYSLLPNPEGYGELNLNTIKDFLSQDLTDNGDPYEAPSTRFDYLISIGEEFKYVFEFTDNLFLTGSKVAFINPSLTSGDVDDSPFKIGDRVNIQQDNFEWSYDSNYDSSGNLGFTSATDDHPFIVGQVITITGQETHPSYNGAVIITDVPTTKSIVVNKDFISATPAEPGSIFGESVPPYNTVATVTDIYWDVTNGYVLETDLDYLGSTPAIGGKIKFADNRKTKVWVDAQIQDLIAYNSRFTNLEYGFDGSFDTYVVQNRAVELNRISTILAKSTTQRHRIERDSKFFLLVHTDGLPFNNEVRWTGYDENGTIVTQIRIENPSLWFDWYAPCGINNIPNLSNITVLQGNILQITLDQIVEYKVEVEMNSAVISNPVWFEVNTDCSRFELYHLMWKDSYGSWISYPLKYIQKNITEFERKNYYQKEGRFNSSDEFGYDTFGKGDTTYYSRSRDKMILNSGWVEEFENDILKDMLESTEVYVQTPDNDLLACVVNTNSQEFKKRDTDYLFNYQFEVRLSNNNYRK
jgi:hypothetical protein